jgi:hypothetical protein
MASYVPQIFLQPLEGQGSEAPSRDTRQSAGSSLVGRLARLGCTRIGSPGSFGVQTHETPFRAANRDQRRAKVGRLSGERGRGSRREILLSTGTWADAGIEVGTGPPRDGSVAGCQRGVALVRVTCASARRGEEPPSGRAMPAALDPLLSLCGDDVAHIARLALRPAGRRHRGGPVRSTTRRPLVAGTAAAAPCSRVGPCHRSPLLPPRRPGEVTD